MNVDKSELERVRELVFGANYSITAQSTINPSSPKPFFGSGFVVPKDILPSAREIVSYKSEFAHRIILRPSDAFIQEYSYWVSNGGLYIPFTAIVDGGMGSPKDGSYFHLYAQFGHEQADKHLTGGATQYNENWEKYFEVKSELEYEILCSVLLGTFHG